MEDVLCWRRATYDECAKVEKMAIKAKSSKLLAIVGYGLLVLIFVILLVPLTIYYNGIVMGILFGVIGTLFTVGACYFIYLPSRKRMALITEKKLEGLTSFQPGEKVEHAKAIFLSRNIKC